MTIGTPFIRPMFFGNFQTNANPQATIDNLYMYGPSILAVTDTMYSEKNLPFSGWCTVYGGISQSEFCFNYQIDSEFDG